MRDPDQLDVIRDCLALVECCHGGDLDGARVILDNCNTRLVATFLSRMCCDLIEDLTESPEHALALLREHHAGSV